MLTIFAKVIAKEGSEEIVKNELLELVKATLTEEGCINYNLHQDLDEPNVFMFYENWETFELWEQHMGSPALERYKKATEGIIDKLVLNKVNKI